MDCYSYSLPTRGVAKQTSKGTTGMINGHNVKQHFFIPNYEKNINIILLVSRTIPKSIRISANRAPCSNSSPQWL